MAPMERPFSHLPAASVSEAIPFTVGVPLEDHYCDELALPSADAFACSTPPTATAAALDESLCDDLFAFLEDCVAVPVSDESSFTYAVAPSEILHLYAERDFSAKKDFVGSVVAEPFVVLAPSLLPATAAVAALVPSLSSLSESAAKTPPSPKQQRIDKERHRQEAILRWKQKRQRWKKPKATKVSGSESALAASRCKTEAKPLSARQQAASRRVRENGKFKRSQVSWTSASELLR